MSTFRSLLLASWFLTVTRTIGLSKHIKKESVLLLLGIGFFPYAKIPLLNLKYITNLCCGSNLTFPCGLESPALLLFLRLVVLQCHHHLYSDSLLHIPLSSQRTWSTHCMPHQHPEKPLKSASGRHHSEPIDKIIYLFCMPFPHSIKLSTIYLLCYQSFYSQTNKPKDYNINILVNAQHLIQVYNHFNNMISLKTLCQTVISIIHNRNWSTYWVMQIT